MVVVQIKILLSCRPNLSTVLKTMQIEAFVFDRAPEPFNEHIVYCSPSAVHADSNVVSEQDAGKLWAGELASLVAVEDFRLAVAFQCLIQRLYAEADIHGVGQTPRKDR